MNPLPTSDLRQNIATWSVPTCRLPAVAHFLHDVLPNESWDPHFRGQDLETTYFDTLGFDLRKARLGKKRYLTLRIRCYDAPDADELYAISAKTESEKWRREIPSEQAEAILHEDLDLSFLLPAHLLARLQEIAGDQPVRPIVTVDCHRYAVENLDERYTLDVDVRTDTGKRLPGSVLEYKAADSGAMLPAALQNLYLRPIKLSKFLWCTEV
jgi:hypothetical protein